LASSNGGQPRRLTPDDVLAAEPQLSPDGSLVAFDALAKPFPRTEGTLDVVAADGTGLRPLGRGASASWSPDGREIAFASADSVYAVHPDGSGLRRIATGSDPAWSPTGTWIAVSGPPGLRVVHPDGSGELLVAADAAPPPI